MQNDYDCREAQMRGGSVVHAVRKNRNVLFSEIVSCRDFIILKCVTVTESGTVESAVICSS